MPKWKALGRPRACSLHLGHLLQSSACKSFICCDGPVISVVPESGMMPHGLVMPLLIVSGPQKRTPSSEGPFRGPVDKPWKLIPQCSFPTCGMGRDSAGMLNLKAPGRSPSWKHIEKRSMCAISRNSLVSSGWTCVFGAAAAQSCGKIKQITASMMPE
eukprot:CAMPEP_0181472442 /NCGR_PEP_ID=MMETSP1110-20121109/39604_1 /TAXON_ID=174948 /ORGANISM="Symbiodinium sp., Strain CCMP421" /LENGTH=157 /DNA_ID=CAMNT_0023597515 /DNA_START=405 /DNA_END=878 /DNA_ORIENTATION=-